MEENKDIQRQPAAETADEAIRGTLRPQDDVPQEVIERYMIRDYQRMYNTWWEYRELAGLTANQIDGRARQLIRKRRKDDYVVADLQLKLDGKSRKITEMYDWLKQRDALVGSLREHCEKQRACIAACEKTIRAQRMQIQSLLGHIGGGGEGYEALAGCDSSWDTERWKEAMVNANAVQVQLGELNDDIMQQPLDEGVRQAILAAVQVVRRHARRAYNRTVRIASPLLRREFAAEALPEDGDGEE